MTGADDVTAAELAAAEKQAKNHQALNALVRAIDAVIITNHGLVHRLGNDRPPWTAPVTDGFVSYGHTEKFDAWQTWRAIEQLKQAADAWEQQIAMVEPQRKGPTA